jgi:hypothetical protein
MTSAMKVYRVPGEERRAGAAPPVELGEDVELVLARIRDGAEARLLVDLGFLVNFVLRNAGRPEQANQIRLLRGPEAGEDLRLARRLPLLPQAVGEDLDLGADAGPVVGDALERDAQGMIAITAPVFQQQEAAVGLGDEQVGGAVVGEVGSEKRLGGGKVQLVEMELGAHIDEARGTFIPEDAELRSAGGVEQHGEVDPAVVVEVDRNGGGG